MKQIRLKLLIVALLGIALASATRAPRYTNYHRYAWLRSNTEGSKYWISKDLTFCGWTKGIDYYCASAGIICTFIADPMRIHTDASGSWFYVADVPQAGIDWSGNFIPLDF